MSDIEEGRRVLRIEAQSVLELVERLDQSFESAVDVLFKCQGKVIVTGMGKSGQIARKMTSTLSSTGTPSVFLHPAESSHGDLGVIAKGDVIVAISYGGESLELAPVISYSQRKGIPLIALSGNPQSSLSKSAEVSLDVSVKEEACPLGLAPTSSSTVTLAMGDALAMALLKRRGFKKEDFAEYHPGGSLGRRLLTRVKDVMHVDEALPIVDREETMANVVSAMTSKDVRGIGGVVDQNQSLVGVITDGDIRRGIEKGQNLLSEKAKDVMSNKPKTIDSNELAEKALFVMEQFQINTLFAVDSGSKNPSKPIGVLHLQDLLKAKIR